MENEKGIEELKMSLALKKEKFNKIRLGDFGNSQSEKEEFLDDVGLLVTEVFDIPLVGEVKEDVGEVKGDEGIVLEDVDESQMVKKKQTINLSNLGTSFFGRKRR